MASSRRFQGLARRLPGAKSPTLDVERELEHAGATVSEWVATHHPLNQLTDDDIDTDWPDHDARLAKFIEENEENAKAKGWNVRQLLMMFLLVEGRDVTRYGYEADPYVHVSLYHQEIANAVAAATVPDNWFLDGLKLYCPLSEREQARAWVGELLTAPRGNGRDVPGVRRR